MIDTIKQLFNPETTQGKVNIAVTAGAYASTIVSSVICAVALKVLLASAATVGFAAACAAAPILPAAIAVAGVVGVIVLPVAAGSYIAYQHVKNQ